MSGLKITRFFLKVDQNVYKTANKSASIHTNQTDVNQPLFSSLINTIVLAIFPNLCLWRRSSCSNLGDIDREKLYRATLRNLSFHAFSLKRLQISLGLFSKNRLEVYNIRLITVNISSSNF